MDYFDYFDEIQTVNTRIIRDYSNPMEIYDEDQFFSRFRFRKEYVLTICHELNFEPLPNNRGLPIPNIIQVSLYYCNDR